jgi:DNA-binding MarR family transcriptional regulator
MTDDEAYARWTPSWLALLRTYSRLWSRVENQMRTDSGLTVPRYDVLMTLSSAGGSLGLTELADAVVLTPSGLSKLLDRMEAATLIVREPDPDDARSTFATLTPRGRSMVAKARQNHHAFVQQSFGDALTDRDLADLRRIMQRLEAHARGESST